MPTPAPIDVLMPVHDGARHLPAALRTLLAQDHAAFRLVVVDDASTDATPDLLADAARGDGRIVVVRSDEPLGVARALNLGLSRCTAPLVARADADDEYAPGRLSVQARRFAREPGLGVLSCGYERIDEAGEALGVVTLPDGHDRLAFEMMLMNRMLHPGTMFRREVVAEAGGYDEAYWTAQDSELWDRLLRRTRFGNVPERLVRYRVHASSVTKGRGGAGRALSLSVPRRALSRYLDRGLSLAETRAAVDLYQGFETLTGEEVAMGADVLGEVDRAARDREEREVASRFRRDVRRGLAVQARRAGRGRPAAALGSLRRAASWGAASLVAPR